MVKARIHIELIDGETPMVRVTINGNHGDLVSMMESAITQDPNMIAITTEAFENLSSEEDSGFDINLN
jgi:hypothetical protein